eukprot:3147535-Pleurochrysis_carterae.AAC.1
MQIQEYLEDLKASGSAEYAVSPTWFAHVFRCAPELSKIGLATGKENFGRCSIWGDLEEAIRKARFAGNAE